MGQSHLSNVLWAIPMLSLFAGGCKGISENDFIAAYETSYCEGYVLCATDEMLRTVNHRECLEWYADAPYPGDDGSSSVDAADCKYDRVAAEACTLQLSTSGCDGDDPEVPTICDEVYSGCEYPRLPGKDGPEFAPEQSIPTEE